MDEVHLLPDDFLEGMLEAGWFWITVLTMLTFGIAVLTGVLARRLSWRAVLLSGGIVALFVGGCVLLMRLEHDPETWTLPGWLAWTWRAVLGLCLFGLGQLSIRLQRPVWVRVPSALTAIAVALLLLLSLLHGVRTMS